MSVKDTKVDISLRMAVSLEGESLVFDADIINNETDTLITDFDYRLLAASGHLQEENLHTWLSSVDRNISIWRLFNLFRTIRQNSR